MIDATQPDISSQSRRRWPRLRLSVRWMMVLVLLIGGGLGWVVRRARTQHYAITLLEARGASFVFDDQMDSEGNQRPPTDRKWPAWQRWVMRNIGDDYVRKPRSLHSHANLYYAGKPLLHPGPGLEEEWRAILALPDLIVLAIEGSGLDDEHLALLPSRLPGLRSLGLGHSTRLTDAGLAPIGELRRLRTLGIDSTSIGDAGLAHLKSSSNLRELKFTATRVTDVGLAHLGGLRQLRTLELDYTGVGDKGLAHLGRLDLLDSLYLEGTGLSDPGLGSLSGLGKLEVLSLVNTNVGDAGLARLAKLDRFRVLMLSGTQIGDASLPHLERLSRIEYLSLGARFSPEGIARLKAAHPSATIE